ncbi:MAG TPA: hypothetical protein VH092_01945 [Urbifossiella sp.]|jgi:uncharacterized protein (TIGR03067 family)|nr:hypothetical protein [Urbifossiella sp.]
MSPPAGTARPTVASRADDAKSPQTKTPPPAPQKVPRRGLTEADTTLLKLASTWHYVNRNRISGSLENYARHAGLLAQEAAKTGETAKLAQLVLASYVVEFKSDAVASSRQNLLTTQFSGVVLDLSLQGALAGIRGEDIPFPFSAEFRNGPGKAGENWVDRLRQNEIDKWSITVLRGQANINIAKTVEQDFKPRMGATKMDWGAMSAVLGMFDNYSGSLRDLIDVKYKGEKELSNVIFIYDVETPGAQSTITPGQMRIMGINSATGFDDKNADVRWLFQVQNYAGSMPRGGIVYVPALKSNDEVRVMTGTVDRDFLKGYTLAMVCDQGYLEVKRFDPLGAKSGAIATKSPDASGTPQKFPGPHLGVWEALGYEQMGSKTTASLIWRISDDGKIAVRIPTLNADQAPWKYVIDDTKQPKQIDLFLTEGRLANKVLKGIYKVENNVLTVCFPKGDAVNVEAVPRPVAFDVSRRSDIQILRLRRVRDSP